MDAATGALRRFLDAQRQRVFTILDGLSEDALRRPALPSGWTCLQLVNHLAAVPFDAHPRRRFERWPDWEIRDVRWSCCT